MSPESRFVPDAVRHRLARLGAVLALLSSACGTGGSAEPTSTAAPITTTTAMPTPTVAPPTNPPPPAQMRDLIAACRGQGVPGVAGYDGARDRVHPVAVFLMDGGGLEYSLSLPSAWHDEFTDADPAIVELVVCIETTASIVPRECPEQEVGYVPADERYTIRVVEAATGGEVAATNFTVIDEFCPTVDIADASDQWITTYAIEATAEEFLVQYVAPEIGNPVPAEEVSAAVLESVCRGVPIPAAGVYDPNAAGPHPVFVYSGIHSEYSDDNAPELPLGWDPGDEASRVQLIVCADRVAAEPARMCIGYHGASGGEYAVQLYDAVYEVTLRRATDAGIVDSTTIEARSGSCPLALVTERDLVPVMSLYPSYDEALEAFLQQYVE